MKREEILRASRNENKSRDLVEAEITTQAGSHATRVGAIVCCILCVIAARTAKLLLYSPLLLYCSMIGTEWLIRFLRRRKKSDLVVSVLFFLLSLLFFGGLMLRLLEVAP